MAAGHLTMNGRGMLLAVGLQGFWFLSLDIVSLKATWFVSRNLESD
jgi:hypothetical protein